MAFIDNEDESDIDGVINDMIIMTKQIRPNRMTLYPKRSALEEDAQRGVEKIGTLRKTMLKNISKLNGYLLPQAKDDGLSFFTPQVTSGDYLFNYLFYKSEEDFNKKNLYDSSAFPFCPYDKQTVLGLGSYGPCSSYSYTENVYVEEVNADWQNTFYKIIKR